MSHITSENQEVKIKMDHRDLYSFKTFKEMYQNQKLMMNGSKLKEAQLNQQ